ILMSQNTSNIRFDALRFVITDAISKNISSNGRFVLYVLWEHCDMFNECNPSYSRLERNTGLSRPTIAKALKELIEKECIKVKEKGSKYGKSSTYILIKTPKHRSWCDQNRVVK
ncbi:MAG: helix-turn-helix domain-containing protein, partial [Thermoguttaceae bacterium]